ncbi:ThiF family adenylyltransferase [Prosthecobacter dejongeii]|uniref:ThiF family protein n=1 Tax=Prosthecobacter dejongeii TaxID=48465 RepID=A0A7W7YIJ3_9BACT|nr:hypothetical protein [Prosthecobacter dejongeii]
MIPRNTLRLTGEQHQQLKNHLFPGDGKEAVALVLCGRLQNAGGHTLCANKILLVAHDLCRERTPVSVTWPTEVGRAFYQRAAEKNMAVLKVHSHPEGYDEFSAQDDRSDAALFSSLHNWTEDGLPHASAVMLPDGTMFGRFAEQDGSFVPITKIAVAGDDIRIFTVGEDLMVDDAQLRTLQTFGEGTTQLLRRLKIGVVGCSGTGSWVIEQLARLGVGELVLMDPDIIERKNLNRIINSREADALGKRSKVDALTDVIKLHGTGTMVTALNTSSFTEDAARQLAYCDILFGCMDLVEGRDRLNRIATFYSIPYFDLGVRLDADGNGGISNVCGVVNYLLPGGSSLLSRGCYSAETLRVQSLRRTKPAQYESELKEGYIKGAKVESPAVVSVNGFCATMAINELLARLHPFRSTPNAEARRQQFDLKNSFWIQLDDTGPCPALAKNCGRGDMTPFLNSVTEE